MTYEKEVLETFLQKQGQLFDEPVAESLEEADEFLSGCMAVVLDNVKEVRKYWQDEGVDMEGMTDEELSKELEVIALPGGRYLIVEA